MRRISIALAAGLALFGATGVYWSGSNLLYDAVNIGQDVASAGGGAQNTTILSYTPPASGLYIVSIAVSCTTTDTVTVALTYTDAINTTAQTVSLLAAVILGANAATSASYLTRANTSTAILVKYTISAQTTTKASAVITRVA